MCQLHILGAQQRKLKRGPLDGFVTNLLSDGAELAWLDEVSQRLTEEFGTVRT